MIFKFYRTQTKAKLRSQLNFCGEGQDFYTMDHIFGDNLFSTFLETLQIYDKDRFYFANFNDIS